MAKIVCVTSCITGIAHTYMAADSLVAAGERAGVKVHVETQGSSGSTPLDPSVIAGAAAVIFATDVGVKGRERFAGKPVVASGVKRAINEPDKMLAEALRASENPAAATVDGTAAAAAEATAADYWGKEEEAAARERGRRLRSLRFVLPPLPNTLYTRDTTCWIYGGVTVNPLYWPAV